jgi:hypothetical protein
VLARRRRLAIVGRRLSLPCPPMRRVEMSSRRLPRLPVLEGRERVAFVEGLCRSRQAWRRTAAKIRMPAARRGRCGRTPR